MALTDFAIIRRSMTSRLFSTVTTAATVAIAVALMLVLLAMKDSGRRAFERGSGNMHLLVSRDSSPLVSILNGVFYAGAPSNPIRWEEYRRLTQQYPLQWAIPVQLGDSYRGFPVLATSREFFELFRIDEQTPWDLASGELFDDSFEIVVGATAARATGLSVGAAINVSHGIAAPAALSRNEGAQTPHVHTEFAFRVVGVLEPTGTAHDRALFMNLDSSWVMHAYDRALLGNPNAPVTTVEDITDDDRLITGVLMRVATRPGRDVSSAVQVVAAQLRSDISLTVAAPSREIGKLFTIVSSLQNLFVGMAAVVMVSSGIAIMLALYNSMEQRRRQIAVLRVMGCSRGRVFGLILTESAMLGALGALAGALLALVGLQVVSALLKSQLGVVIDASLPLRPTLAVLLAAIILASLAGVVPAMAAYRTSVAKNLRPLG